MSSLGDLLLGKVRDRSPSPASDNKNGRDTSQDGGHMDHQDRADEMKHRSPQPNDDPHQADSQKIFPNRIVKNEVKDEEDCRSNTSSTDDYVRELLDPNDRPRNVWHVVEGPKKSSDDENETSNDAARPISRDHTRQDSDERYADERHHHGDDDRDDRMEETLGDKNGHEHPDSGRDDGRINDKNAERVAIPDEERDLGRDRDRDRDHDRERDRDRGHSRDHDRNRDPDRDRDRDRHRHKHRDRDRDHDRRRSHRSSHRRHDYSDDNDDDRDDDRRRRHGSRHRSSKRSHSRSLSRRRSRSGSQSPVTKRNSRTVLVMQLSPRATTRDLEDFFSDLGDVREVRLIMDSKTRRHKGIAYIEFENASSASKALSLDGKRFLGVPMQIQSTLMDRNRGDWHHSTSTSNHHHHNQHHHSSSINTSSHSTSRSNLPPNSYRIYIGGLHVGITEDMLRTIVEPFGSILRLELIKDRNTGISRGYAFVLFANIEDGQEAVRNLDGFELAGKNLRVSKSTEKTDH